MGGTRVLHECRLDTYVDPSNFPTSSSKIAFGVSLAIRLAIVLGCSGASGCTDKGVLIISTPSVLSSLTLSVDVLLSGRHAITLNLPAANRATASAKF